MVYFRRNPYIAGNICFLFVLALLFSLAFTAMPARALAADPPVESIPKDQTQPDLEKNEEGFKQAPEIVTTPDEFASFIQGLLGRLAQKENLVTRVVYKVYETVYSTVYQVYRFTLWLVYGPPPSGYRVAEELLSIPYRSYADPENPGDRTVEVPVPIPKRISAPAPEEREALPVTRTEYGESFVNKDKGQLNLVLDANKCFRLLAQRPESLVIVPPDLPPDVELRESSATSPASVFNRASSLGIPIKINLPLLPVSFGPNSLPEDILADSRAKLEIKARLLSEEEARSRLRDLPGAYQVAGNLVRFTITVTSRGKTEEIDPAGPVFASLRFDEGSIDKRALGPEWYNKLGMYRDKGDQQVASANADSEWAYVLAQSSSNWEYVGGRVNLEDRLVTAKLPASGNLTVMAYNKTFGDIQTHWAKTDIEVMASRHIARGVTDDTFDPEGKVTRAQFVALLTRTLGIPENKAARAHFTDVQRGDWYHGNVEAAFAAGLVKGYEDGTFRPNAHITRQEIAVMVARGVQYGGRKVDVSGQIESLLSRFIDQNQISWWAREGAAIAVKEGIVLGRTTDQYVPDADSTRAEATVMLKRALRSLGEIR